MTVSEEIRYELEVVKWEGKIHCAYLNNFRIAGGKPWAGGQTVKKWSVTARDVIQSIPELKTLSENYDAAQSELTALKAELASEEQDHAELRDVVAALREENERLKVESFEGLYNAVIDERDALREELAEVSGTLEFNTACWGRERAVMLDKQQTLTADLIACGRHRKAAEQRNAELAALLTEALPHLDTAASAFKVVKPVRDKVRAALKPTESGVSE